MDFNEKLHFENNNYTYHQNMAANGKNEVNYPLQICYHFINLQTNHVIKG